MNIESRAAYQFTDSVVVLIQQLQHGMELGGQEFPREHVLPKEKKERGKKRGRPGLCGRAYSGRMFSLFSEVVTK